jgi:glutamate racemase
MIGVFDSGVGGLSVWREIARQLPHEDTLYVADQAHVPYGRRSLAEVRAFSEAIVRFLFDAGAQVVVVACNTASAAALHHLRATFPQAPFVGMEPAVKPAAQNTRTGAVGVLATPATFQGELFASLLERFAADVEVVTQICPGLVEAVEAGALDTPQTESLLRRCLQPLLDANVDQLVLGCTHYPFVRPLVERLLGPAVEVIDPAPAVARQTGMVLAQRGLASPRRRGGRHVFCTTGHLGTFVALLERLVGVQGESQQLCWHQGHLARVTDPGDGEPTVRSPSPQEPGSGS